MFDDWKAATSRYIIRHIDREPFKAIAEELDGDITELTDLYIDTLLDFGVIGEDGGDNDLDFDEDDLLEAILDRFLADHPGDEERALLYAELISNYLELVEENSEDL
ncbi:MAG: hypothetical protein PHY64_12730 [Eubacteriales bacterium]|nr:hypothetical protein [Eubacteriales bacterium]